MPSQLADVGGELDAYIVWWIQTNRVTFSQPIRYDYHWVSLSIIAEATPYK